MSERIEPSKKAIDARAKKLAYQAEWYRKNWHRIRKQQQSQVKRYNRDAYLKLRNEQPEKWAARNAVHTALRNGSLVKPYSCEDCGKEFPSLRIHSHHEDYSKPLEVNWLCSPCHGLRHTKHVEAL